LSVSLLKKFTLLEKSLTKNINEGTKERKRLGSLFCVFDFSSIGSHRGMETGLDGGDGASRTTGFTLNEIKSGHGITSQARLGVPTHVTRHILHDVFFENGLNLFRLVSAFHHTS